MRESRTQVTLHHSATCVPGDNITVVSGAVRPHCKHRDCSCWPSANASTMRLLAPDEPIIPEAIVLGAHQIGTCSNISIDLSTSRGSCGRDWQRISWAVNSTLPASNMTALRAYMTSQPHSVLRISNSMLVAGATYHFTVMLENFLGFSSISAPHTITILPSAVPDVQITTGDTYSMYRHSQLDLFADASVAVCPGRMAKSTSLVYEWLCAGCSSASSSSRDPRRFQLAPFTLNVSQV